ncbi:hypothetical protein [Tepidibacter thalassicus]|uniref:Uncharacterized protein n=1 Tax=Tepidibacter thalassicus DSM 15285 TaxID=1123350 RepID=A0A1M5SEN0_9FIRM|nr:hypothetical protein [Tepidibacter thalassicus]SHH36929.1 hypothetical protein SAMN02744040_01739 [Tepidibacter thalassicus DSM 15285]
MSYYSHVMLEVYCAYDYKKYKNNHMPSFCKKGIGKPGYHCFENECEFISYTNVSHQISYVGELSEVKTDIGFGGEMEPTNYDKEQRKKLLAIWENICKNKIKEAYDEYMKVKNSIDYK